MAELHRVRGSQKNLRQALAGDARLGGMTLVLGAGVSLSRGLCPWRELTQRMWSKVLGQRPLPEWLEGNSKAVPHPLAYAIVFEELEHALRSEAVATANGDPIARANERFADLLHEALYAGFVDGARSGDTLDVLAKLVRGEQRSASRRIARVITFNADDLLESECNRGYSAQKAPAVWPIARASNHPRRDPGAEGRAPIPIYHLHGFLPYQRSLRAAPETLVFADAQYWRSVASPGSFANRVMSNTLQDSHCVFIGLSMEDVNLMRWLGLRQLEVEDDFTSRREAADVPADKQLEKIRDALNRHYWITTAKDDPSRIIASHLERRGVATIFIDGWGAPFEQLIADSFPPAAD